MNEHELRLGNYMQDGNGRLCQVKQLPLESFGVAAINGPITTMPVSPITLTEEWLVKLGFREEKGDFILGNLSWNVFSFLVVSRTESNHGEFLAMFSNRIRPKITRDTTGVFVSYVHQIQNLYFTMTGDELKLKTNDQGRV